MPSYIFLTTEGSTYQPDSESCGPDVENVQMLGIAGGADQADAFRRLIGDNTWLLKTSFDEVFCYELADGHKEGRRTFHLSERRRRQSVDHAKA